MSDLNINIQSDPRLGYIQILGDWWLRGGIPAANCIAAYQPAGAVNQAASYVNLANPGVDDAVVGTAPTWNASTGWIFDGATQYLTTAALTSLNSTVIVRFSDIGNGGDRSLVGAYEDETHYFAIVPNITGYRNYKNGNMIELFSGPIIGSGIIAIAGKKGYMNGVIDGNIPVGGNIPSIALCIAAVNYTPVTQFLACKVQAFAKYNIVLTDEQIRLVTYAMDNLHNITPDINYFLPPISLMDDYISQGFGALICWGMPTFVDQEIADPNIDVDTFAPSDLDVDQWLDAVVSAGMNYAYLTVKHHNGFALYPTAYHVPANSPYSIAQTAWYSNNGSPDIVGLFVAGCQSRNIKPGFYFSIHDTTYETRSGTDETTDAASYIAMIETQLSELLTNYGSIYAIWLDGWNWVMGYEEIPWLTIRNYIKSIQPACLVIDNAQTHPCFTSEIEIYETGTITTDSVRYCESVKPIRLNGHWFYNSTDDHTATGLKTVADIRTAITTANTDHGNYNLGLYVGVNGHLTSAEVVILSGIP